MAELGGWTEEQFYEMVKQSQPGWFTAENAMCALVENPDEEEPQEEVEEEEAEEWWGNDDADPTTTDNQWWGSNYTDPITTDDQWWGYNYTEPTMTDDQWWDYYDDTYPNAIDDQWWQGDNPDDEVCEWCDEALRQYGCGCEWHANKPHFDHDDYGQWIDGYLFCYEDVDDREKFSMMEVKQRIVNHRACAGCPRNHWATDICECCGSEICRPCSGKVQNRVICSQCNILSGDVKRRRLGANGPTDVHLGFAPRSEEVPMWALVNRAPPPIRGQPMHIGHGMSGNVDHTQAAVDGLRATNALFEQFCCLRVAGVPWTSNETLVSGIPGISNETMASGAATASNGVYERVRERPTPAEPSKHCNPNQTTPTDELVEMLSLVMNQVTGDLEQGSLPS